MLKGERRAADLLPRHRRRADRLHLRGPARLHLRHASTRRTSACIGTAGEEPEIPLADARSSSRGEHRDPKTLADAILRLGRRATSRGQAAVGGRARQGHRRRARAETSISALTQAVGDDAELRDRLCPWLGLIRRDLRDRPFVVLDGGLVVKETPSRKNAGAHYTPKSLAEEVVLHALQPLCYSPGPAPDRRRDDVEAQVAPTSSSSLKVADIACGSGAFLVAAARYLADRVVEAWTGEDPANAARAAT